MRKHQGKEVIISGRAEVCTALYSKLFLCTHVVALFHVGEGVKAVY